MEYIKEHDWFNCTLDGITYRCYLRKSGIQIGKRDWSWVNVTVRKHVIKKWWIFKWNWIEFEYESNPDLNYKHYDIINGTRYFKPEAVKEWIMRTIDINEREIEDKRDAEIKEKEIKVIKDL